MVSSHQHCLAVDFSTSTDSSITVTYTDAELQALSGFTSAGNTLQFKVQFKQSNNAPLTLLALDPPFQFDETAPADISPDSVLTTGSVIKAGYWNSTSTGIKVYTDIDADASLEDGTIQILGYFGATATIDDTISSPTTLNIYPNDDQLVTVSNTRIESIGGFTDGEVLKIASIITDYAGNSTIVSASSSTLNVDQTAPTIDGFTSTPVFGTFGIDATPSISIEFDEAVTLDGQIDIDLTGVPTDVSIGSFSNDDSPSGTYTVVEGDSIGDLDVDSVLIAFGSLRDLAGNDANVSRLGSIPLASNSNLHIDGIAPLIKSFSSSQPSGILGIGDQIDITINFTDEVELAGSGSLKLYLNGVTTPVDVSNPSGNSVTATYTISETDQSTDLSVDSLSLTDSATLKDDGGNSVTNRLTLTGVTDLDVANGEDELVIDGEYPASFTVGPFTITGPNVVPQYWNQDNSGISVRVPVNNDPSLDGGTIQLQGYTGTNTAESIGDAVTLETVGDTLDVLLDSSFVEGIPGFSDSKIFHISAIITDNAGNSKQGGPSAISYTIDQTSPTISGITSSPSDDTLGIGNSATITLTFNEEVKLIGAGTLRTTLETGELVADAVATLSSFSLTDVVNFSYEVSAGESSADLDVILVSTSGATLQDSAGNEADLSTLPPGENLVDNSNLVIDGAAPVIQSIYASTATDTAGVGEIVDITVRFNENVSFSGGDSLNITLETGDTDQVISATSISGTEMMASYTVSVGDSSLDLTVISLEMNAGSLVDAGGNSSIFTLPADSNLADNAAIKVDGIAPIAFTVGAVTITGPNVVAGYWNQDNSGISVSVPIKNDPSLDGGTVQLQGYIGSNTPEDIGDPVELVAYGSPLDVTLDSSAVEGISSFANGAELHFTAVLTDNAGNSTSGTESASSFDIDQLSPTITSIFSDPSVDTLGIGDNATITLTFNEDVKLVGGGTLRTELETGDVVDDAVITLTSFALTDSVIMSYTVSADEYSTDLDVNSVSTSAATLQDSAGNTADLSSIPTGENLSDNSALTVDGEVPFIQSIYAETAADTLGIGESLDITVRFSENVSFSTGSELQITLDTGDGVDQIIDATVISSGEATATLTVAAGDSSLDLTVTGIGVDGGDIIDIGGNAVVLTTLPADSNLADNAAIIVDGNAPADFTVGAITINGTNPTSGYWNGSDTLMNIAFDIGDDQSLVGGRVYVQGYFASISGRQTLGSSYTIGSGDIGDAVIIPLNQSEVESHTSFDDDKVYHITALIEDYAGNEKLSSAASTDTFYVDRDIPVIDNITSLNADGNYGINDNVNVRVNFSEPVNMSGATLYTYLNTNSARVLDTNSIDESDTLSFNFMVAAEDNAAPLSIDSVTTTSDAVYDLAGNLADLSIPDGANLDVRSINLYGDNPVILNITTTSTSDAFYKIGDAIDIIVTFEESVSLDTDSLLVSLETGDTNRVVGIAAGSINNTSQATFSYEVLPGDSVDVLSVFEIRVSGTGTLANIVGNPVDLAIPTEGTILSDFDLHIDGVVPDTIDTGDIVVVGDPVVSGYYNATTDSIRVTLPISAFDGSLISGSARLQGRVDENPFVNIGGTVTISTADPITITLSAAQVEALPNFAIGDSIQIRGVITDMPGNQTLGNTSETTLQIDVTYPDLITEGTYAASGGIEYNTARWNATNTQYTITAEIPNDSSMIGGLFDLRSRIGGGTPFAESGFDSILVEGDIGSTLTMNLSAADLNTLLFNDGDTLRFTPVLTDRAGNVTESTPLYSLIVDYTAPGAFDLETMLATGGTIRDNYFNLTNDSIEVTINLPDGDNTLIGGELQLRVGVNLQEDVMSPVSVTTLEDITISVPRDTLEALIDWGTVQTLEFDAILTDVAGNTTSSPVGQPVTVVDQIPHADNSTGIVTTSGGTISPGYWMLENNQVNIIVPLDDTDLSMLGGEVFCMGRVIPFPFETFLKIDTLQTVDPTHIITIDSTEIVNLTNFGSGKFLEFQAFVLDQAGNATVYDTSLTLLEIDVTPPANFTAVLDSIYGENLPENTWNANSDSLALTLSIPDDSTMVNGYADVTMQITEVGSPSFVLSNIPIFTVNTDTTIIVEAVDIQNLANYDNSDGEYVYTRIVMTDRAGNQTAGSMITDSLFLDIAGPAVADVDTVMAYNGNIVVNAFNSTNAGITIHVPIADDPTLSSGYIIPQFDMGSGWLTLDTLISITDLDTVQIVTLDSTSIDTLAGFDNDITFLTTVTLRDNAGNETQGNRSIFELFVDRVVPGEITIDTYSTSGSNVVEGYWNSYSTGLDMTVPIDDTDNSLIDGIVYSWIHLSTWQAENFIVLGDTTEITAFIDRQLSYTAAEIEGIVASPGDFSDGAIIVMEVDIIDAFGNSTTSTRIDTVFVIDQTAPDTGHFIPSATYMNGFVNADDTLAAAWDGFADPVSDILRYEYSIGSSAGLADEVNWYDLTLDTVMIDTFGTFVHADSFFINVRSLDSAGNISDTISTQGVVADLIRPLNALNLDPFYHIGEWNADSSITGIASDELSGVDSVWVNIKRMSDSLWWNDITSDWQADSMTQFTFMENGSWQVVLPGDSLDNRIDYQVEVMAIDSAYNYQNPTSVDIFQFVINSPPEFLAIADTSIQEDTLYNFILPATDLDLETISGDSLFYSMIQYPDSAEIDSLTGMISWTPLNADVGLDTLIVRVRDHLGEADTTQYVIEVLQVNDAPEPVTLLLPADSTQLSPSDSLLLTFSWTTAFDIEDNPVTYRLSLEGADYDTMLATGDTSITVDVSVMDFPSSIIEWYVRALDQADTSAVADTFHVTTSSAFAVLNTDSIAVNIARLTEIDTSFTLSNLGLTDLRWSLLDAPAWISLPIEADTIEYDSSAVIAINISPAAFTVGGYGGQFRLLTNDPLQDTITVKVSLDIFDVPAPVVAFYKNRAYPSYYEMMIVDSLGMIDSLSVTHSGLEVELTTIDTFSYVAVVEVSTEGLNAFEVYAENWVGDTTITVNVTVSLIKRGSGWLARSPDEQFEIKGSSNSAAKSTRIAVLDSMLSANDDARYKVLTDGVVLAEPVLVSMPALTNDQAIYIQDIAGDYVELASVSDGERVRAWAATMGSFKLGPRTIIVPEKSQLSQNYPNPFNPTTTIDFDIGFLDGLNQDIRFSVYNIRGQEVRTLMETQMQPGSYSIIWNGLDDQGKQVSSGLYFARLMTGKGYAKTVKMLVLR